MQRPPFTALAAVYDAIMADIEYGAWAEFILTYLRSEGCVPRSALDLACGTGGSTRPLVEFGLDVTGLDGSADMLAVAARNLPGVPLVHADLRDFRLERTFDLVTCVFDSYNNLTEPGDLGAALTRAREHLNPGGWLAFDVNTRLGVRELWEEDAIEGLARTVDGREVHYRWSHAYDPLRGTGTVQAWCRMQGEEFVEVHEERGYDPADLEPLLAAVGFERWECLEFPDYAPPDENTPRVWVFAQAPGSQNPGGGDA